MCDISFRFNWKKIEDEQFFFILITSICYSFFVSSLFGMFVFCFCFFFFFFFLFFFYFKYQSSLQLYAWLFLSQKAIHWMERVCTEPDLSQVDTTLFYLRFNPNISPDWSRLFHSPDVSFGTPRCVRLTYLTSRLDVTVSAVRTSVVHLGLAWLTYQCWLCNRIRKHQKIIDIKWKSFLFFWRLHEPVSRSSLWQEGGGGGGGGKDKG